MLVYWAGINRQQERLLMRNFSNFYCFKLTRELLLNLTNFSNFLIFYGGSRLLISLREKDKLIQIID
jgi:hypothetical protein